MMASPLAKHHHRLKKRHRLEQHNYARRLTRLKSMAQLVVHVCVQHHLFGTC